MTLSPNKRALLEKLKQGVGGGLLPLDSIAPQGDAQGVPLSFAQQRFWFLDRLDDGRTPYNIGATFRILGPLEITRLHLSLNAIVRRHETLRTVFRELDGIPLQIVQPTVHVPLPIVDLSDLEENDRHVRIRTLESEELTRCFDLGTGPLLRVTLVHCSDDEHLLLLIRHHIVADAWSLGIFIDELGVHYDALAGGQAGKLTELPIRYADYAAWQRQQADAWAQKHLEYWKRQLGGELPILRLPVDRSRPGRQIFAGSERTRPTFAGSLVRFEIPAALSDAITALSHGERLTPFMTLLAVFQLLLGRHAAIDDVLVGCPVANRTRRELEPLIGLFANTLVMRGDLSGEPTFRTLLRRVRATCLDAYAHQDLPFEQLVDALHPQRDLSRSPLFQAMFALQNAPASTHRLRDLSIELTALDTATAMFDLTMALTEAEGGIQGAVEYNTDLFDRETVRRLAERYVRLLACVVADPDQSIGTIPLLGSDERHAVLAASRGSETLSVPAQCVHGLFEAQAARTPDAIAVADARGELTYAALDRAASQLARQLRTLGVGPEVPVAICLDRSVDLVVAILAALKAGGAYVPLDPDAPAERLAWLLADTGARVVLTQASLQQRVARPGVTVVLPAALAEAPFAAAMSSPVEPQDFDPDGPAAVRTPNLDSRAAAPPGIPVGPANIAYIIYTSGSTGTPKGVMVTHANVMQSTVARTAFYREPITAFLLLSSITFDSSVAGLFWTLCSGGTLVIPPVNASSDADALGRLIERYRVSHVLAIPSLYHLLLDEAAARLGSLRTAIVAGEACPPELVSRHQEIGLAAELVNEYGPTEATVWSTAWRCDRSLGAVPIGRPISRTQAYVLDGYLNPVPAGVAGELYLGGDGIARGYLGRPDLTAERFVPDPFTTEGDRRLYRTGDVARYRADGQLEFLGRSDRQVKVRGVRVELAEIEHALARHPNVREAAVVATGPLGDERLAAFFVATAPPGPAPAELDAFLQCGLPRALRPSSISRVDALPRGPNGKIDYGALPAPRDLRGVHTPVHVPRSATEELLAGIWAELLRMEQVDVQASFFDLGGHSLLAARVLARAREALGVELPLGALFEAPSIAALAARFDTARRGHQVPAAPCITALPRQSDRGELGGGPSRFPLSFAQERLWFLDRLNPGCPAYNVPTAARLTGQLDRTALAQALGAIVARHEALRTSFEKRQGRPSQTVWPEVAMSIDPLDLRQLASPAREAALAQQMAHEARRPFNLDRAPLLRTTLLQLADNEHVLLLTTHHIVSDAWSLNVFFRELSTAYAAVVRGEHPPFSPLPIQYADYAVWQREWLDGVALEGQLSYWKQQLDGTSPPVELPRDFPRPAVPSFRGALHAISLSSVLSSRLTSLARHAHATPFMLFLAAFATLLHRYTDADDIVIGTPVAGRRRAEVEELIGFFVNILVVRLNCAGSPTFRELLHRVKTTCLEADAHQDLPFERLVHALDPVRDLSRQALFQVAFAVQNAPADELTVPDLTMARMDSHSGTAKFDVTVTLTERPDGWQGSIEYCTDLFESETVRRLAERYVRLLESVVADPDQSIGTIPLLGPEERHAVLAGARGLETLPVPAQCVHELFEAQAARTPDAIAVVDAGRELTYSALDRAASQLARQLRTLGVGPEVPVAICLDRSVDLVVAILAALKAGGAYVPLDPDAPAERLAWLLADTGARVVLTQASLQQRVAHPGVTVVLPAALAEAPFAAAMSNPVEPPDLRSRPVPALRAPIPSSVAATPGTPVGPANLAYIIYTSGSTGTPKGVLVTHANVVRLFAVTESRYQFSSRDVWTLFHSASFDFSVWELWGALLYGGKLVIVSRDVQRSPDAFYRLLVSEGVTVLNQTPSAFRHLARVALSSRDSSELALRLIIFGGEALDVSELQPWFERFGDDRPRLVNMYGITETTVHVTYRGLARTDLETAWSSPIGRPLADLQAFILDRRLQPAPPGVPGELYIGGAGVARGYLGRADLTADRFVPDPFGLHPGGRLYRTGDRARLGPNGDIEYLGRLDYQVKVRGFRIETGEIEAVLAGHPLVGDCVVVGRKDRPGETRLIAYVVGAAAAEPRGSVLRRWLEHRLPDYMLPAEFVVLDRLPRTSGGKIDRRALPAPRDDRPDLDSEYVAPSGAPEQTIARIWSDVLQVKRVGVHDNFFALGGSSLLLAQVHAMLQEGPAPELAMVDLFKYPTVRALADHLQSENQGPTAVQMAHARADARLTSLAQQRLSARTQRNTCDHDKHR